MHGFYVIRVKLLHKWLFDGNKWIVESELENLIKI